MEDVGRIRLADVDAPEIDTAEGIDAKDYVYDLCYLEYVYLDIDDLYVTGTFGRYISVVYIPYNSTHLVNLNQLLLKEGYAVVADYDNEFDPNIWVENPLEYVKNPSLTDLSDPDPATNPDPDPDPDPTPNQDPATDPDQN